MTSQSLADVSEFRSLMDQLDGAAIWIVTERNRFEYISGGFEDISGTTPEEVKNDVSRLIDTIHPEDRQRVVSEINKPDDEVSDEVYESRIVRPDGEVRWLKVRQHPIRDDEGDLLRIVGMATDITEQKQREEELRRQRDQLDAFASVLSHDLRNPLNVAEGRLKLAREECDSEHLDAVAGAHTRMEQLIDDLLALARAGEQVAELEPVELAGLSESCWWNVDTAQATLVADTDRTIRADRTRLAQLLENLFRNAVEHDGEDVTITVGDLSEGFYVADDGPGIPEEDRDRIFDSGYTTSDEGTGFGLAIVEEIIEAHEWDIRVTESEAGGAQFEITGVEFAT